MKKKIFALAMVVLLIATMLTGCIQNNVGVKMNKDGTGSISASVGIKKESYQNLKQMGTDPFEGKTVVENIYEDGTYVTYTEVKEYDSYEDMEKALLEMKYDTDLIEKAQVAQGADLNREDVVDSSEDPFEMSPHDNRVFSAVSIEENSGIFYSSYTFSVVMNPQTLDTKMNDAFKVLLTVEMPEEITQFKGGRVEGNKITFDIADVTTKQEFAATCEVNHTGVVIGIVVGLAVLVAGFICLVKFKK